MVAKHFKKDVSKEEVINEASILSKLSHRGLPYVLGIDLATTPFIMVTLFYGIDQKNTTLHELLDSDSFDAVIKLDKSQALPIIAELSETLSYIHDKGFLHNDIKSDNIVFYVESATLKPVLVDFGKVCPIKKGEYRKLSPETQQKYRQNHSHIAPEIVDGTAPQSPSSDVYSIGRVVIKIGEFVCWEEIVKLGGMCAEANVAKRCTLSFLIDECKLLGKNTIII